jgi:2-C-methyl-D-erythritol 4-phosphate cytidylyltransferase
MHQDSHFYRRRNVSSGTEQSETEKQTVQASDAIRPYVKIAVLHSVNFFDFLEDLPL